MIYLDTSVALAHLLAEGREPPASIWEETVVSSRLIEYEIWTRIHARGLARTHAGVVRDFLAGLAFVELAPTVLARAVEPFPRSVRTLDALHLASVEFLRGLGQRVRLATYDQRMLAAATAMGIDAWEP